MEQKTFEQKMMYCGGALVFIALIMVCGEMSDTASVGDILLAKVPWMIVWAAGNAVLYYSALENDKKRKEANND